MGQPRRGRSFAGAFRSSLEAFSDGAWVPLRQLGMVGTMRPDWDSAPSTFRALAWYAGLLLLMVATGYVRQLELLTSDTLGQVLGQAAHAVLMYTLSQAFYVCIFTAVGRWVIFWDCVARTASPLQLLGMTYSVCSLDQALKLVMNAALGQAGMLHILFAAKDVAIMALAVVILVDFFRPRPPRRPRRRPEQSKPTGFEQSTRPAPV